MAETLTTPNKLKRPNYLARQIGAATFMLTAFAGAIEGGEEAIKWTVEKAQAAWNPDTPDLTEGKPGTETYTVQHGDTLWGIADEHTTGDPRPLVDEIRQQPDVKDGLHPGDKLTVPENYDGE